MKAINKTISAFISAAIASMGVISVAASHTGSIGTFRTGKWYCENHSTEYVELYSTTGGRMQNVYDSCGTVTGMFSYNWDYGNVDDNYQYADYFVSMLSGPSQGGTSHFTHYLDGHIKVLHNFYHE